METDLVARTEGSDAGRTPAPGALAVLQSCSRIERRAVKSLAIHLHVDRGQIVCEAGEFGDELFVLLEGAVAVQTPGEALSRLGAGDGFGEMSPLARTPRRSTVVALGSTELLVFRRRELALLLDRAPRVGRALLRAASTRLRGCPEPPIAPDHPIQVDA